MGFGPKSYEILDGILSQCDTYADEHIGFAKLEHSLAHKKGVDNPKAMAAAIGRKKYGAAGMAKKAAAGRK